MGNGSDEILELLVRAFLPAGGEVLSTTHTFLMYGLITKAVGGVFRPVPLKKFRVDLDGRGPGRQSPNPADYSE